MNYNNQELIDSAVNGSGVTNGSRMGDSLGVMVPHDYARFLCATGDAVGVRRGHLQSDIQYYIDPDYGSDNMDRMAQSDINQVNNFMSENNVIPKLNAYVNSNSETAWADSGMSSLNDSILQGFDTAGMTPSERNALAERVFWNHYIQNYGELDPATYGDYTSTNHPTGAEISNYFGTMSNESSPAYDDEREELIQILKNQVKNELSPVNKAVNYDPNNPTPGNNDDITGSNNYYSNQLKDYNTNYNDAAKKIDAIVTKLTNTYDSFSGATGNDITKIRNDLTSIINGLNDAKTKIKEKQQKSNDNAESCYRCYQNWNTRYGKAYIDQDNGMVYYNSKDVVDPNDKDNKAKKDEKVYASINTMLNS